MWAPFLVAIGSVALGTALAVLPGVVRHVLGPARTFALAAALTVVGVHLLPEAASHIGMLAFGGLALGLVVPALAERIAVAVMSARGGALERGAVAVHVSFAGLLVHQVGDGMGLWAFAGGARSSIDVALALGAHTVPLTMLVVLGPLAAGHRGLAFARALALALATCVGVGLGMLVPAALVARAEPWTAAVVSGLLVHVLWHDVRRDAPRTARARAVDLAAAALGVTLAGLGALAGGGDLDQVAVVARESALAESVARLAFATGPLLLLGLVLGGVVKMLGARVPRQWIAGGGGRLAQTARGAALGVAMPISSRGVLPVVRSLHARGASTAVAVAFALAAPALGLDTLALTLGLLGPELAVLRAVAALALALAGAWTVASLARGPVNAADLPIVVERDDASRPVLARALAAMSELSRHAGPWTVLGVVLAAYVDVTVAPGSLASWARSGLDVLLVSALAIPSYLCAPAAVPLAAVLVAKGLSPGAALVGLLLGPATSVGMLAFFGRAHGRRAAALGLGAALLVAWAAAALTNALPVVATAPALELARSGTYGWLVGGCTGVLAVWLLADVWRAGLRGWLSALSDGSHAAPSGDGSSTDAVHVHGPGCGHTVLRARLAPLARLGEDPRSSPPPRSVVRGGPPTPGA